MELGSGARQAPVLSSRPGELLRPGPGAPAPFHMVPGGRLTHPAAQKPCGGVGLGEPPETPVRVRGAPPGRRSPKRRPQRVGMLGVRDSLPLGFVLLGLGPFLSGLEREHCGREGWMKGRCGREVGKGARTRGRRALRLRAERGAGCPGCTAAAGLGAPAGARADHEASPPRPGGCGARGGDGGRPRTPRPRGQRPGRSRFWGPRQRLGGAPGAHSGAAVVPRGGGRSAAHLSAPWRDR